MPECNQDATEVLPSMAADLALRLPSILVETSLSAQQSQMLPSTSLPPTPLLRRDLHHCLPRRPSSLPISSHPGVSLHEILTCLILSQCLLPAGPRGAHLSRQERQLWYNWNLGHSAPHIFMLIMHPALFGFRDTMAELPAAVSWVNHSPNQV